MGIVGACLGVGPAVALAAEVKVAGLVLVAPFLSVRKMFQAHLGASIAKIVTEPFPNEELAPHVKPRTLIFHGGQDKMVPIWHSEQLCERLRCENKLVHLADASHHT